MCRINWRETGYFTTDGVSVRILKERFSDFGQIGFLLTFDGWSSGVVRIPLVEWELNLISTERKIVALCKAKIAKAKARRALVDKRSFRASAVA